MPRGDGTGPNGLGSRTGRAVGFCTGNAVPGYMNPVMGRGGFGRGSGGFSRGGGRGFRNMYRTTGLPGWIRYSMGYPVWGSGISTYSSAQPIAPEQEAVALKTQAKLMQEDLKALNERIQEMRLNV